MPNRNLTNLQIKQLEQDELDRVKSTKTKTKKGYTSSNASYSRFPSGPNSNQRYESINAEEKQYGGRNGS